VTIELLDYKPNRLLYKSTSNTIGQVVFSEIFYQPGWNAYIDGTLTEHFRVNYVLRSMVIPSGEHEIEFKFEPSLFSVGEGIALASSSLLLLIFIGSIFIEIRSMLSKENSFEENV
jgi:Predicted membrane protein